MFNIRTAIILVALGVIIFKFTSGISAMNSIKEDGETLLLKLQPVDPRALMMGDYMALAYDDVAFAKYDENLAAQGALILRRDENNVGSYSRLDDATDLATGEIRVKYALKRNRTDIGSARFYFQEGAAETYQGAQFGVFKVSPSGHMILVALADEDHVVIKYNSSD